MGLFFCLCFCIFLVICPSFSLCLAPHSFQAYLCLSDFALSFSFLVPLFLCLSGLLSFCLSPLFLFLVSPFPCLRFVFLSLVPGYSLFLFLAFSFCLSVPWVCLSLSVLAFFFLLLCPYEYFSVLDLSLSFLCPSFSLCPGPSFSLCLVPSLSYPSLFIASVPFYLCYKLLFLFPT